MTNGPVDISPTHLAIARRILSDVLPKQAIVWAFGSRARWTTRRSSDLDLAIDAGRPLTRSEASRLSEQFEESDLPYKVDVVDWHSISPGFRAAIEQDRILLPQDTEEATREGSESLNVAGEWPTMTLADMAKHIAMGPFGSDIKTVNFVKSGVPVIRGNNLNAGRFNGTRFAFLTEQKADELRNSNAYPGDIVITHRGTLGQVGIIPSEPFERYVVSQSQMVLACEASVIEPMFLYYFLKSAAGQHSLLDSTSQTGVPAISRPVTSLKGIRVPTPPLAEQRAIAGVLGALDDKIEQNRRTARALERLARAIFRAWFVDFEPVKAKAEGATAFPSMPQPVFDALPTRFVDSPIGPVPEGWEVKAIKEAVQLTMGQSPKSEFYNETGDGLPFHQGVSDYGFRFPTHRVYCTVDARIAEKGDVLLSVRAPVGRINVADRRLILGRGLAGLRERNGNQSFLLHQMAHVFAEEDAIGDGTIYKAVTKEFLAGMPTLLPPAKVAKSYSDLVQPTDDLVYAAEIESRRLAEMRDYLLPKLLSGELRVELDNG